MKKEKFSVILQRDNLVFSAAHFLTYDKNKREAIHGHNFKLSVQIGSDKLQNSMVIDFLILENIVISVINQLKDKLLIAQNDQNLHIELNKKQIIIRCKDEYNDEYISVPASDCVLLPISNTSTELIANYIGKEVRKKLPIPNLTMKICLEEAVGCIGIYELEEDE